jgi:TnpA family transposase
MIEGVLRHCTAMQVDRNYVDTCSDLITSAALLDYIADLDWD